jgi:hypothetical protein
MARHGISSLHCQRLPENGQLAEYIRSGINVKIINNNLLYIHRLPCYVASALTVRYRMSCSYLNDNRLQRNQAPSQDMGRSNVAWEAAINHINNNWRIWRDVTTSTVRYFYTMKVLSDPKLSDRQWLGQVKNIDRITQAWQSRLMTSFNQRLPRGRYSDIVWAAATWLITVCGATKHPVKAWVDQMLPERPLLAI